MMRKKWNFCFGAALPLALISSPVWAMEESDLSLAFHGEVVGGYFSDDALEATAGRETQVWKMSRVLLGADIDLHQSAWSARIELVPLADEVELKSDDSAYVDYYKNLGTELLYYGDYPVREAFARYEWPYARLTAGRVVNPYGLDIDEAPYVHRHEAPHAYYLDKELVNGLQLDFHTHGVNLSLGVYGGRGKPNSSYNHYLDGDTDPNIKGNNTPILEADLRYTYLNGGYSGTVYAGYHQTKTGSAPGSLYSGKHNDERMNIGFDMRVQTGVPVITGFRVLAQYHQYTFGLTEEGVQGRETPELSLDIEKRGAFGTVSLELFDDIDLQYTYEELDRMDTRVWDKIANFDPNHASFDSVERNQIYSVHYRITPSVALSAFYRRPEFDYQQVSGIRPMDDVDKMGVTITMAFEQFEFGEGVE